MKQMPNILTAARLLMVPTFLYAYAHPGYLLPERQLAFWIFGAAGLTDLLDGYIARKYDAISSFGKLFDPLADKMMTLAALFCLCRANMLHFGFLAAVLAKEGLMVLGSFFMLKHKVVVYSNFCGKLATFVLTIAVLMSFWPMVLGIYPYVMGVGVILTLLAFFQYGYIAISNLRKGDCLDSEPVQGYNDK